MAVEHDLLLLVGVVMVGWAAFLAAVAVLTGGIMNVVSILDREVPGDLANNPFGWAGSKFWRLGVLVLGIAGVVALVQAII